MEKTITLGTTATVKETIRDINATLPDTVNVPSLLLKKWLVELRNMRLEKKNQLKHKKAYK